MSFGQRLYEIRKNNNVSQEELAEMLEVSRQSVSKWENDKAYPELNRLLYISDRFGVSLDYLIRGSEEPEKEKKGSFSPDSIALAWSSFLSNLSPRQRRKARIIYLLAVALGIALLICFFYSAGEVVGKTIYNIQNP